MAQETVEVPTPPTPGLERPLLNRTPSGTSAAVQITASPVGSSHPKDPPQNPSKEDWRDWVKRWMFKRRTIVLVILIIVAVIAFLPAIVWGNWESLDTVDFNEVDPNADGVRS